jgi:hypothetical protein
LFLFGRFIEKVACGSYLIDNANLLTSELSAWVNWRYARDGALRTSDQVPATHPADDPPIHARFWTSGHGTKRSSDARDEAQRIAVGVVNLTED